MTGRARPAVTGELEQVYATIAALRTENAELREDRERFVRLITFLEKQLGWNTDGREPPPPRRNPSNIIDARSRFAAKREVAERLSR